MYSPIWRAEAMLCVTTTYVPLWIACISWISSHSSAVRTGSSPESGSSKITMSGSMTSARAKPARLRIPPESCEGASSIASPRPTSLSRCTTRSEIIASVKSVCWRSGNATLSYTDIDPNSAPSWNSTPILRRSSSSFGIVRLGTDCPLTRMSPESGNISPIKCLISTLLPVPEGPSTTVIVSSGKATLRPLSTGTPPRRLCTARQRVGVGAIGADAVRVHRKALGGEHLHRGQVVLLGTLLARDRFDVGVADARLRSGGEVGEERLQLGHELAGVLQEGVEVVQHG